MTLRRGSTLIELLCAVSVLSAVLALSTGLIVQLQRAAANAQRHTESIAALDRLTDRFRLDVAAAQATPRAEDADAKLICRLQLADGTHVEYRQEPQGIARISTVDGSSPRRERYQLGASETKLIVDGATSEGALVALLVTRGERAVRIEAASPAPLRQEEAK